MPRQGTDHDIARQTPIELTTPKGIITGVLARAEGATGGMIMLGGAGGGIHGPAGIYPELAERLQADGITALRLEYREPNDLPACVYDTLAGVTVLRQFGVEHVVLLGWSFGGAVVITAGAQSDAVVGVATVASQTYGTSTVSQLAPRCLLLLHGTGDTVLPDRCARELHARASEPKELILYPNDNHGLTMHREQVLDKLQDWTRRVLAAAAGTSESPIGQPA